jgi:4-diphosphocytidyl-2-C-methyl-D-erythritol kinase
MFVFPTFSRVLVHTPAKINLYLEVLARRADGFHEIETLMGAVTLFDTLEFVARSEGDVRLTCRWASGIQARGHTVRGSSPAAARREKCSAEPLGDLPQREKNIVHTTVAELRLTKRIPSAAGLGGASSDAAAALVAANLAWNLHWSLERLAKLAAELGSDIPFFLSGGWAVCRGSGECIAPDRGGRLHLVMVRPRTGLGTAEVYRQCRPAEQAHSLLPLQSGLAAGNWREIRRGMTNRLEGAAGSLNAEIGMLKTRMNTLGCVAAQMSGSGSSCFGICRSARHARRVATQLRAQSVGETYQATMAGGGRTAVAR